MPSRRNFIATSAAAVAAASFPRFLFAQQRASEVFTPRSLGAYTQGTMTLATFQAVVGSVFTAFLDNNQVAYLTLQKATAAQTPVTPSPMGIARPAMASLPAPSVTSSASAEQVSFQLVFNNGGATFDQGTYLLDHGTLGEFACFLVPGVSAAGPTSCATFCFLSAADALKPAPAPPRLPGKLGLQL